MATKTESPTITREVQQMGVAARRLQSAFIMQMWYKIRDLPGTPKDVSKTQILEAITRVVESDPGIQRLIQEKVLKEMGGGNGDPG